MSKKNKDNQIKILRKELKQLRKDLRKDRTEDLLIQQINQNSEFNEIIEYKLQHVQKLEELTKPPIKFKLIKSLYSKYGFALWTIKGLLILAYICYKWFVLSHVEPEDILHLASLG